MEVWKEEALGKEMEKGIRSFMESMKFNHNQAMDALNIPAEQQPMYAARIPQ